MKNKAKANRELEALRAKINDLDTNLIALLNDRVSLAREIGHVKSRGEGEIYVPERERAVYKRVLESNSGPIPDQSLQAIYREIMSASIALERKLVIAYLGPEATFSHQAALLRFGESVEYLPVRNVVEIMSEVERGNADYGVVPVENSIEGAVSHTADALVETSLRIYAEMCQKIPQNLLSAGSMATIREVYSHPQPLGQCRSWLRANLPDAQLMSVSSTSEAARLVAGRKTRAAIACELAGKLYGVPVIKRAIQDYADNITRFIIVGKKDAQPTGQDKTSIIFSLKDRVGVLFDSLETFKKSKINMTRIESRPSKKRPWEYYFFVDLIGHRKDKNVAAALAELEKHCVFLKILGSYPRFASDE